MLTAGACADTSAPTTTQDGTPFDLNIAALTLNGVADAVWDIKVENEAGETVFTTRISSNQYGDGKGSASYVGTCDAQTNGGTTGTNFDPGFVDGSSAGDDTKCYNKITVDIRGIYSGAAALRGFEGYGDGVRSRRVPDGRARSRSLDFQNPGPLTQVKECKENGDTFVQFDVALMRPAQQGFFDIAVNFNDIFCSAKFDCDAPRTSSTTARRRGGTTTSSASPARPVTARRRSSTWMTSRSLATTANASTAATTTIDTASGDGNLCTAGSATSTLALPNGSAASACNWTRGRRGQPDLPGCHLPGPGGHRDVDPLLERRARHPHRSVEWRDARELLAHDARGG
ncbi:MAG: hypothetical protein H6745_20130 [Deltaproteobacteria bacterium]|nr:hypothetical protein [Deltaproteobacteria bacterium]